MKKSFFNLIFLALVSVFAFLFCHLQYSCNQVFAQTPEPYININETLKKLERDWHVEKLKEKIKEASKEGKVDEVKDLVDDLEAVKGALKDSDIPHGYTAHNYV